MDNQDTSIEEFFMLKLGRELTDTERNSVMSDALQKLHDLYLNDYNLTGSKLLKRAVSCVRCAINWNFDEYGTWLRRLNREIRTIDELTMSGNELVYNVMTGELYTGENATLNAANQNMHLYKEFNYVIPEMRGWDCAVFRE